jgi:hypothetical protein
MRSIVSTLLLMCVLPFAYAQQPPAVFTADYYLVEPDKYLGKSVTLSVAYVNPRNEQRDDGLRQLDAQTYNQHHIGGEMMILAPPAVAARILTQCGTNRSLYVTPKTTMVLGIFSQEKTGSRRYYLFVAQ